MKTHQLLLLSIFFAVGCCCSAEMGGVDFQATPERPVGWRGDGTGRYPAATPPVVFERTVKSPLTEFRSLAKKPDGDGEGQGGQLLGRFAGDFRITEWLVLGPVSAKEGAKPLEGEAIAGEAGLSPDEGDVLGELKWKRVESSGNVNFAEVLGEKPGGKIGYALAYFWSPEACVISMNWQGRDARQWLNGKNASGWERAKHEVKKGWNRLLVKMVCPSNQDAWQFKVNFFPNVDSGVQYNEKNIRWARPMPASSWSMPVLCGDKLFVTSEPNDLICLDKRDGKMLWVRSNPLWYAAIENEKESPGADGAARDPAVLTAIEAMRPQVAQLEEANAALVKNLEWAADEKRRKLSLSLTEEVKKLEKGYKMNIGWGGGNTGPTPVTDGKQIFAWFGETGVMTCFDLDGKRLWTRFEKSGSVEHGINASPVLSGSTLAVIAGQHWVAFDKTSGKVLWRQKYAHPVYGTCIVTEIAGTPVLIGPNGQIVRVSDGEIVAPSVGKFDGECASPVLVGNRFFLFARAGFCCVELPSKAEKGAGTKMIRMIMPKVVDPDREVYPVGTPVFHEGILYAARSGWGAGTKELAKDPVLYAFDPALPEPLYRQKLDLDPVLFYGPEGGGVCASLAYAGGNIYVLDNRGTMIVFKPGKEYRQVARSRIDHWTHTGYKEVTGSTPIFEGGNMYLRGREMMYCIGGDEK